MPDKVFEETFNNLETLMKINDNNSYLPIIKMSNKIFESINTNESEKFLSKIFAQFSKITQIKLISKMPDNIFTSIFEKNWRVLFNKHFNESTYMTITKRMSDNILNQIYNEKNIYNKCYDRVKGIIKNRPIGYRDPSDKSFNTNLQNFENLFLKEENFKNYYIKPKEFCKLPNSILREKVQNVEVLKQFTSQMQDAIIYRLSNDIIKNNFSKPENLLQLQPLAQILILNKLSDELKSPFFDLKILRAFPEDFQSLIINVMPSNIIDLEFINQILFNKEIFEKTKCAIIDRLPNNLISQLLSVQKTKSRFMTIMQLKFPTFPKTVQCCLIKRMPENFIEWYVNDLESLSQLDHETQYIVISRMSEEKIIKLFTELQNQEILKKLSQKVILILTKRIPNFISILNEKIPNCIEVNNNTISLNLQNQQTTIKSDYSDSSEKSHNLNDNNSIDNDDDYDNNIEDISDDEKPSITNNSFVDNLIRNHNLIERSSETENNYSTDVQKDDNDDYVNNFDDDDDDSYDDNPEDKQYDDDESELSANKSHNNDGR